VHHGNGTQAAFYDDPDVLTISLHQDNLFPANSGGWTSVAKARARATT
jgi:acetoin utilization deacetylase AcuC-like enzyme